MDWNQRWEPSPFSALGTYLALFQPNCENLPFSQVAWLQIFCLTFLALSSNFENLAAFFGPIPMCYQVPECKHQNVSTYTLNFQKHTSSLTVESALLNISNPETGNS